jgi:hypothetical protein
MSNKLYSTPLSDAFFSPFNREYLHGAITREVRTKTGMTIDRQSDSDLQALMRRVYMHMMSAPSDTSQVKGMNQIVVREATKTISTGILQQLSYIDYITKGVQPMEMPISTSTYGNKMPSNNNYGF